MTREAEGATGALDRLAHAFTPSQWTGRGLGVAIVGFAAVGVITVVQRALVADSTVGWVITGLHALIVAVGVPALSVRAVREWRRARGVAE